MVAPHEGRRAEPRSRYAEGRRRASPRSRTGFTPAN